jgi:hypothetical protein
MDRKGWWSAYIGGGVWEVHTYVSSVPYNSPMSTWETAWNEIGGARKFMESIPFWQMQPRNDLVTSGNAYCLAEPGYTYALYLPEGGQITVNLEANTSTYYYEWWKASNNQNGYFQNANTITVNRNNIPFTAPGPGDWALRIEVVNSGGN